MGTCAGQKEFFRLEKSLCPFIELLEPGRGGEEGCHIKDHIFDVKKKACMTNSVRVILEEPVGEETGTYFYYF